MLGLGVWPSVCVTENAHGTGGPSSSWGPTAGIRSSCPFKTCAGPVAVCELDSQTRRLRTPVDWAVMASRPPVGSGRLWSFGDLCHD